LFKWWGEKDSLERGDATYLFTMIYGDKSFSYKNLWNADGDI